MTISTTDSPRTQRIRRAAGFVQRVRNLKTYRRGEYVALKRNAGNTIAESRGCMAIFELLNRDAPARDEEIYFLVATLIGHNELPATGNMGDSMRRLYPPAKPTEPIGGGEKRLLILLDSRFDQDFGKPAGGEMAFRLRTLIRLLSTKGVGVNFAELLVDLCDWDEEDRRVQKRWAYNYYGQTTVSEQTATEEVAEPAQS